MRGCGEYLLKGGFHDNLGTSLDLSLCTQAHASLTQLSEGGVEAFLVLIVVKNK